MTKKLILILLAFSTKLMGTWTCPGKCVKTEFGEICTKDLRIYRTKEAAQAACGDRAYGRMAETKTKS